MADKHPKSKLKRKKSAVIEYQADIYQRDSLQKFSIPFNSPDLTKDVKTDSSKGNKGTVSPTVTWWTRNDLNLSEKLWASTIETVLPFLGSEHWDPLPEPSTVTPRQSEWQRPVPADEVPPFPEPSRPPGSPPRSPPQPLRIYSPAQPIEPPPPAGPLVTPPHGGGGGLQAPETTAASRPVYPPQRREDSRPALTQKEVVAGRESVPEKTSQYRDLAGRPVRPFPLWSGSTTRAKEAPLVMPSFSGEHLADRVQTMRTVQEAKVDERVVEHEVGEAGPSGAQRKGGGEVDGPKEVELGVGVRERLQCCPMCTLVFPSRFSQMDCDSHLAQCLSEMNVDMAW
ncbi:unnamed protein product [Lota lota]